MIAESKHTSLSLPSKSFRTLGIGFLIKTSADVAFSEKRRLKIVENATDEKSGGRFFVVVVHVVPGEPETDEAEV